MDRGLPVSSSGPLHLIVNVEASDSTMVGYALSGAVMGYLRPGDTIDLTHDPNSTVTPSVLSQINEEAEEFGNATPPGITISAHSGYIANEAALANGTTAAITALVATVEPNGATPGLNYSFATALAYLQQVNSLAHAHGLISVGYPSGAFLLDPDLEQYHWNYGQLAATTDEIWVEMQGYATEALTNSQIWPEALENLSAELSSAGQPLSKLAIQIIVGATPGLLGVDASQALADIRIAEGMGIDRIDLWTEPGYESYLGATLAGLNRSSSSGSFPTPIQHVFLIMMENEGAKQVVGSSGVPYQTYLANTYAWGGDAEENGGVGYYSICHPSTGNYIGLTSGQPLHCGSDGYATYSVNNLGNELQTAGLSWIDYEESATKNCQTTNAGLYAVRHNPFPYYTDLGSPTDPSSVCYTHVVPIANLIKDYPYNATPPAFTYIVPNEDNDAHNTNAKVGDVFLQGFVSQLVNQSWFANTVIFITYDESGSPELDTGYDGLAGGPVPMFAVSPYSLGIGAVDQVNTSHYNLLSTIEWLLGLPPTGTGKDGTAAFPAIKSLFNFGPPPVIRYPVSGVVQSASGAPLAGAEVFANASGNSSSAITNQSGGFTLELVNGTYTLSADDSGMNSGDTTITVAGAPIGSVVLTVGAWTYSVSGAVDSSAGLPLAGAQVFANTSGLSVTTFANRAGGYAFPLENGTYIVSALAPGWGPGEIYVLVAGANIVGANLTLGPSSSRPPSTEFAVSGVVQSIFGAPLEGAAVFANDSGNSSGTVTNESGGFTFLLSNGTYIVLAVAPGWGPGEIYALVAGSPLTSLNLTLQPSASPPPPVQYSVSGFVRSSYGTPVDAAALFVNGSGGLAVAVTNGTGGFTFGIANGTYTLSAVASGWVAAETTLLVDGAPVEGVNLTLFPFTFVAEGTVYAVSGSPVPAAVVYANGSGSSDVAVTNETGGFAFTLPNGSYVLVASARASSLSPGGLSSEVNVTIAGAGVTGIVLILSPPNLIVGGAADLAPGGMSFASAATSAAPYGRTRIGGADP